MRLPMSVRYDPPLTLAALGICLFATLAGSVHAQVLTVESNAELRAHDPGDGQRGEAAPRALNPGFAAIARYGCVQ